MTERTQLNTELDPEIKEMLRRMAATDRRTLKGELEWLITNEQARREQPRTMVDTKTEYDAADRANRTGKCPLCGKLAMFEWVATPTQGPSYWQCRACWHIAAEDQVLWAHPEHQEQA